MTSKKHTAVFSDTEYTQAVSALADGGVVAYPTDTAYGLGVRADKEGALEKLYELKGRPSTQPTHIVAEDEAMAEEWVVLNDVARTLMEVFLPGPLTIILPAREHVSPLLRGGGKTLGIRMPKHETPLQLVRNLGVPITTPSANRRGDKTSYSVGDIHDSFGEHFGDIVVVLDAGTLPHNPVSTVVDLTQSAPIIVREGAITKEEINRVVESVNHS